MTCHKSEAALRATPLPHHFPLPASSLPCPAQLLDKSEAALQATPQAKARRQQLQARGRLVEAFDLVRVTFGAKGISVKPETEVLAAIRNKSTHRGGVTVAEAERQVRHCVKCHTSSVGVLLLGGKRSCAPFGYAR